MHTITRILAAAERIGAVLFIAIRDGDLDADDARELHRLALAELAAVTDEVSVADVVEWAVELVERDPARMRRRADELEAQHPIRAARLRDRALVVERRQGDGA